MPEPAGVFTVWAELGLFPKHHLIQSLPVTWVILSILPFCRDGGSLPKGTHSKGWRGRAGAPDLGLVVAWAGGAGELQCSRIQ